MSLRSFMTERSGSVSLIFGIMSLVLFAFIGAAVDYSRWSNAHGRTVDALDAALLMAGRQMQTGKTASEAIRMAEDSFLANASTRLRVADPTVRIAIAADGNGLEGQAQGKVRTPFLGMINVGDLQVMADARVGFSLGAGSSGGGSDLEISMMLDVTGSMCADGSGPCTSSTKMDALKAAASDLVNIIMRTSSNPSSARIALVPFATRVRVGRDDDATAEALMKKLTNLDPTWSGWYKNWHGCSSTSGATSETAGTWSCAGFNAAFDASRRLAPCVIDRTGPAAFSDAPPGPDAWLLSLDGTRRPLSWDSSDTPILPGNELGNVNSDPSDLWNYNAGGNCWEESEDNIVMPLTNDKSALLARIDDLVGFGATAGTLGTAWTWYTLSPKWSAVWGGSAAPGSYADLIPSGSNPPKLRKIAVLMTDGVYNSRIGWLDQDPVQMANDAKTMCTNMKTEGIEIFTVGFDLDSLSPADKARAIDTLQSCGTDLSHFYEALNAEQLKQSFRDIAMQLTQLYVAK